MASAEITYCEGYLWDVQVAKDAIRVAMEAAGEAGRTVALALSDSYCVERHRAEWLDLIEDRVDVVFANEAEVCGAALDRRLGRGPRPHGRDGPDGGDHPRRPGLGGGRGHDGGGDPRGPRF